MLFFVFTSISFILFMKSLSPQPLLPPWASDMRILPIKFWKDLSFSLKNSIFSSFLLRIRSTLSMEPRNFDGSASKSEYGVEENQQGGQQISVLDLPELTLECILEKLPPAELVSVRGVCSSLRERCTSDHLWEKHMNQKWGRIIGPAAHRQWQWFLSIRENSGSGFSDGCGFKNQGLSKFLVRSLWGFSWFGLKPEKGNKKSYEKRDRKHCPVDSVMSWYLALETGKLWFPAQVYNRENGHVGFMLSCYDAELSYDAQTDTFQARYPPHGRRSVAIENGVQWERLRAPPVGTSPHDLHFSDCLNDLRPGDNIEIQWRRNKEFPYGWWYGVVGHLELCDGNESFCRCHNSDTVVLEFNQYAPGSRWRRTTINRKDHREEGNEGDGFYGGIRKLYNKDDISTWKRLWPTEALE